MIIISDPRPNRAFACLALLFLFFTVEVAVAKTWRVGPDKRYKRPSQVAQIARDGDIVEIAAGTYQGDVAVWQQNNLVLRGMGGYAHLQAAGKAAQGKAIWVIRGDNATVENIEFSGAKVSDKNGAGIRAEGKGLKVKHCFFHDNENGILGGKGDIVVERSEFKSNGYGDGYSHNIYISRRTKSFTLKYSYMHHAKVGHNVKSRARENRILYNRIMDEETGTSSYLLDIPNGGLSYVIGNLFHQGQSSSNHTLLSYGAAKNRHKKTGLYIVNNTFVNDYAGGNFVKARLGKETAIILNNIFVGSGKIIAGSPKLLSNLWTNSPGVIDRGKYDYRISSNSPARDAGSDPGKLGLPDLIPKFQYKHPISFMRRVISGAIDIGAYEYIKTK